MPGLSNKMDVNVPLMSLKNVGNADGAQNIDNEPMPGADTIGEAMPLRRQEHAPIELRGGKPVPFQAGDRFDRCRVRHSETVGDIRRARLAAARQKVVDQFDIILEDRRCLCRTRLFKASGLHRLDRQLGR